MKLEQKNKTDILFEGLKKFSSANNYHNLQNPGWRKSVLKPLC